VKFAVPFLECVRPPLDVARFVSQLLPHSGNVHELLRTQSDKLTGSCVATKHLPPAEQNSIWRMFQRKPVSVSVATVTESDRKNRDAGRQTRDLQHRRAIIVTSEKMTCDVYGKGQN
jgi:hypothetical protein